MQLSITGADVELDVSLEEAIALVARLTDQIHRSVTGHPTARLNEMVHHVTLNGEVKNYPAFVFITLEK